MAVTVDVTDRAVSLGFAMLALYILSDLIRTGRGHECTCVPRILAEDTRRFWKVYLVVYMLVQMGGFVGVSLTSMFPVLMVLMVMHVVFFYKTWEYFIVAYNEGCSCVWSWKTSPDVRVLLLAVGQSMVIFGVILRALFGFL